MNSSKQPYQKTEVPLSNTIGKKELERLHYVITGSGKEFYIMNGHYIPAEMIEDNDWIE